MNYPVQGYRTIGARSKAAGFQSRPQIYRAPNPIIERLLQRANEPPWGARPPNTLLDDVGERTGPRGVPTRPGGSRFLPPMARGLAGAFRPVARRLPMVGQLLDLVKLLEDIQQPDFAKVPEGMEANGWTLCRTCTVQPPTHERCTATAQPFPGCDGCFTGQLFGSGLPVLGSSGSCTFNQVSWWKQVTSAPSYSTTHVWVRPSSVGSQVMPEYFPAYLSPLPAPQRAPMIDPLTQTRPSSLESQAFPQPIPYRVLPLLQNNPYRAPRERTETGSDRRFPFRPRTRVPRPVGPRKPEKRVKERKFTLAGLSGGPLRRLLEQALEGAELGDCVADAAGAPKGPLAGRMAYAYRNYQDIDGCKLVECLINNELEDRWFGLLGKASKKAAGGRPVGELGYKRPALKEFDLSPPKVSLGCD